MWAQIPHSQHVFERLANDQSSGMAFAWGFEAAVLMFVVRNMHIASWFFAGLSALINVKYYEMGGTPMWGGALGATWGQWLIALANPFVIAMYSHVLAHISSHASAPLWWHQVRGCFAGVRARVAARRATGADSQVDAPAQPSAPEVAPAEDALAPITPVDVGAKELQKQKQARGLQLMSEGLTNKQISEEVQVSEGTVKSWRRRYGNGAKEKVQG